MWDLRLVDEEEGKGNIMNEEGRKITEVNGTGIEIWLGTFSRRKRGSFRLKK